ncbi:MAG: hypothetical protein RL571_3496 [Pseudomonadota bacterium]|jgi:N-hydroxyarylamine O-acetyltransferase
MQASNFNLADYLKRIAYQGQAKADLASMTEIMRCQLFTVPFENLDVQAGKVVSLVPEDIVNKIVYQPRGGYCYEVNGLFAMALQALGINYKFIAARPMFYPVKRPKTHMAIIAHIAGEDYLCDLGFGSYGIRAPIALSQTGIKLQQDFDFFMLDKVDETSYLLKAELEGKWANQYAFDLYPQEWIDFSPANFMNSTHPDAIFVQKLLIVLHNPSGRKILLGDALKTVNQGITIKESITLPESVLSQHFGLVAPSQSLT